MKPRHLVFIAAIWIFIVTKLLGWTYFVSSFLALSLIILYFLWQSKKTIWFNIIWGILIFFDAIFLILLLVPTKAYNINTTSFYAQRKNYMKIYIKDPPEKVKAMAIIILRKQNNKSQKFIIRLWEYKKNTKIPIFSQDKIYFVWLKQNKSYAAIYLWDGTILRITPWTKLVLSKITKNLENLAKSQTKIRLESGNIWFHVIKLIEGSSNMQIQTSTWQWLIIRWTAWLVSKPDNSQKTYAIDYDHFIEAKNTKKSVILKAWEWAIITEEEIKIIKQIKLLLQQAGLDPNIIKQFPTLDKKDLENYKKELLKFLQKEIWNKVIAQIQYLKLKLFAIWDKNYKEYLENFETYEYLLGKTNQVTQSILNNPNLAFIASNLQKQSAKVGYLYNQLKQNIENSDLYKTYIINLWIEWKIKNISNQTIQQAIKAKKFLQNYFNNLWK